MPRIYVRIDRVNVYVAIFPMENEQKICYQFCSAITNLALALNLLIYHSKILKFWGGRGGELGLGGGKSQGAPPPLYETLDDVEPVVFVRSQNSKRKRGKKKKETCYISDFLDTLAVMKLM